MATEALDLPRDPTITIRLTHRLRILIRAMRIARARRAAKLLRQLADHDERVLTDVGVSRRRDGRYNWLEEMVMIQSRTRP